MPNLQLEAAANGSTSFRESMGMLGDAEDKAKRPVVTPDTVKLPPCGNPIGWGKLKVVFSVRLPQSLDRRLGTNAKSLLFPFCPTKKKISRPIHAFPKHHPAGPSRPMRERKAGRNPTRR
jgi:hypothetical protein